VPLKGEASSLLSGVRILAALNLKQKSRHGYWDPGEGTGTRPDYLVNRVPKILRGHPGKKISQKPRNSGGLNGRGCGCIGTVDSGPKCAQS